MIRVSITVYSSAAICRNFILATASRCPGSVSGNRRPAASAMTALGFSILGRLSDAMPSVAFISRSIGTTSASPMGSSTDALLPK